MTARDLDSVKVRSDHESGTYDLKCTSLAKESTVVIAHLPHQARHELEQQGLDQWRPGHAAHRLQPHTSAGKRFGGSARIYGGSVTKDMNEDDGLYMT